MSFKKIKINLCVFDNPITEISDQITYLVDAAKQDMYKFNVSKNLKLDALNICLENFNFEKTKTIKDFCEKSEKSIGVLLTEYISFENGVLKMYNRDILAATENCDSRTKQGRLFMLLKAQKSINFLFKLGESPQLLNFNEIYPSAQVLKINYPKNNPPNYLNKKIINKKYDIFFSGRMTNIRREIIKTLSKEFTVCCPEIKLSPLKRANLARQSKVGINLPISFEERTASLMRNYFYLKNNIPCLCIGTKKTNLFDEVFSHINGSESLNLIKDIINNHNQILETQIKSYNRLCQNSMSCFPSSYIDLWARCEGF